MSGFLAVVDFNNLLNKDDFLEYFYKIQHLGPDFSNYKVYFDRNNTVFFGHHRLSILDLRSAANQPFEYENYSIIYNGEVYNFSEIQQILINKGHQFVSNSDTEVILKSYIEWGEDCLHKFNGMFSICIYDRSKNEFFLARDRAGVKPLYYSLDSDYFSFSSELKSIINKNKELNINSVSSFFQYGYVTGIDSIYKNIYKLKPGNYLKFSLDSKKIVNKEYWNLNSNFSSSEDNFFERKTKSLHLLKKAVQSRMVSDVPVGVFLSGGYDSAVVASLMCDQIYPNLLKSFTLSFENKKFDESDHAKKVSDFLGIKNHKIEINNKDIYNIFENDLNSMDQPLGDISIIPTIHLSRIAKNEVSVALGGNGGDEIFGGYTKYNNIHYKYLLNKHLKGILKPSLLINKFLNISKLKTLEKYISLPLDYRSFYKQDSSVFDVDRILNQSPSKNNLDSILNNDNVDFYKSERRSLLHIDFQSFMVDSVLVKSDRASMLSGLELREPLLDYRLVEYAIHTNTDIMFNKGKTKSVLKSIAHDLLPKKIMERKKAGFGIPLNDYLKGPLKEFYHYYTNKALNNPMYNSNYLNLLIRDFENGNTDLSLKIYYIIIFEKFRENHL